VTGAIEVPALEMGAGPLPSGSALLEALGSGANRAADPDPEAPDGWRVRPDVKAAILAVFADRTAAVWQAGPLTFRDRAALPPIDPGPDRRIVPGGTAIRAGAHLEPGVIVMPPSYVNVGAWVGEGTMVDSHVLVGSCAQIGARVHLAAGVTIGGVLEPVGALPVIVEDEVLVGGNCGVYEGTVVRERAVLAPGTLLTGGTAVFDLMHDRVYRREGDRPLEIPAGAVVVPGTRPVRSGAGARAGLALYAPVIVKYRDEKTDTALRLEELLR